MSAYRALVIYKKSAYQLYVKEKSNSRLARLINEHHVSVSRLWRAHQEHIDSLKRAKRILRALGVSAYFRSRRHSSHDIRDVDCVITLGGDGTLLWASHRLGDKIPVVAINTAPSISVGYFCAGTRPDLDDVLVDLFRGRLAAVCLNRMRIDLDQMCLSSRVLNDALFAHKSPATMSRYIIRKGARQEDQKSSGIWISTAAGSTGAVASAGGTVMPVESSDLQFVVRELYRPRGQVYKLDRDRIKPGTTLRVVSKMLNGALFIDGAFRQRNIPVGSTLTFRRSSERLTLLGFRSRT